MRKIILFLLIPFSVFGQSIRTNISFDSAVSLPVTSGLVTRFSFWDRTSLTVENGNKISKIVDGIGSVSSTQATDAARPVYHANGGPGNNGYATFSGAQKLTGALLTSSTDFTLFIVRRVATGALPNDYAGVFLNGTSNTNGYGWLDMQAYNGWNNATGGTYQAQVDMPDAHLLSAVNTWEVCVLSHSAGVTKIYNTLGDLQNANPAYVTVDPLTPTGGHIIGQIPIRGYFKGDISDILLYSRQLSDAEVKQVCQYYQSRISMVQPSLIIYGGDSITQTSQGNLYLCTPMYELFDLLPTKFFYLKQTAVVGRGSLDIINNFNTEVISQMRPGVTNIYSLMVGHNDLAQYPTIPYQTSADSMFNRVQRMCNMVRAAGGIFVLKTTLRSTDYPNAVVDAYNARLVAAGNTICDYLVRLDNVTNLQDPTNTTYFYDGHTHLSYVGAQLVATTEEAVLNTIPNF